MNASPAAGAVDGDDLERGGAGDLLAVLVEHGAVLAVGDRDELARVASTSCSKPVDDEQVGHEVDRARRRGVEREEATRAAAAA